VACLPLTEKKKLGTFVGILSFVFVYWPVLLETCIKIKSVVTGLEGKPAQNFKQYSGKEKRVTSAQNNAKLFRGREDSLNQGEGGG